MLKRTRPNEDVLEWHCMHGFKGVSDHALEKLAEDYALEHEFAPR